MYFGDNDSARQALVKDHSPILPSLHLVMQCVEWDYTNKSAPWYASVPTETNIADAPSRLEASKLLAECRAKEVRPVPPIPGMLDDLV